MGGRGATSSGGGGGGGGGTGASNLQGMGKGGVGTLKAAKNEPHTYTAYQYNRRTGESKPLYHGTDLKAAQAAYDKASRGRTAYIRDHTTGENVTHNF